jgi:hypothetical protein
MIQVALTLLWNTGITGVVKSLSRSYKRFNFWELYQLSGVFKDLYIKSMRLRLCPDFRDFEIFHRIFEFFKRYFGIFSFCSISSRLLHQP